MTCIVGIASRGIVYMGADSAGSDGWAEQVVATPKLFQLGPFLIGYTTSFRMGQLLQHWIKVPGWTPGQDPVDFMVRVFVEEARRVFRERGFAKIEDNREEGGEFLVGFEGRLFNVGPGFQVLAGSAGFLLPALSVGAIGGIMALANIAPGECIEIQRLFSEGKIKDAQNIQVNLIPLNTAVTSKWGVAALKTAMDNIGLYGGPVRGPLLPLSSDQKKILNSIINMTGLKKI